MIGWNHLAEKSALLNNKHSFGGDSMKFYNYGILAGFLLFMQCSQMIFAMKSKKEYDSLIYLPMNLYNSGMRNYISGNYWKASFYWAELLTKCPEFYLDDKATYYLGNCYRYLGMFTISKITLEEGIQSYDKSDMILRNKYSLGSINFIERKYDSTLVKCGIVISDSTYNEIKPSALFLSTLAYFNKRQFSECKKLFDFIANIDSAQYALTKALSWAIESPKLSLLNAINRIVACPAFINQDSLSTRENKLVIISGLSGLNYLQKG